MSVTGVIFFGDSVLAGTGASDRDKGCSKLVKAELDVPVSLKGKNWNTTQEALLRLNADVSSQKHLSHVVILFGNNDCWPGEDGKIKISPLMTKKNLKTLIERIQANQQVPMVCNLQPIDADRYFKLNPNIKNPKTAGFEPAVMQEKYNTAVEEAAEEMQLDYLDIRRPLSSKGSEVIAMDGLHPNDAGHAIIANIILQHLSSEAYRGDLLS